MMLIVDMEKSSTVASTLSDLTSTLNESVVSDGE
jgi:hypothetical protein